MSLTESPVTRARVKVESTSGLSELRLGCIMGVKVNRIRVDGQQREPDIIRLRNRTAEWVLVNVPNLKIFIYTAGPSFF